MGFGSFSFIIKTTLLIYSLTCSSAVDSINQSQLISDGGRTLVSNTGSFELGFFSPASSNKNRYLGVWYKTIPIRTVVWVANRCNPINDSSGTLMISNTNNIVLLGQNKTIVWFTNTSIQAQKPILQVLDSGNVVLRDANDVNSDNYLWQSFDHPSDTLLPNMKMGWDLRTGINRGLSSWRNPGDPCPEDFTYGLELGPHTYPEAYIRKGTAKYYRTGPWNGLRFSGSPKLRHNPVYGFHFVYNDNEVYYMYKLQNSTAVSRTVINQTTGTRDRLKWIEAEKIWKIDSFAPGDYCDSYGVCGANGICDISDNPVCRCLTGFKPRSLDKWNLMDRSQGCERSTPLSCSNKDGFLKFGGIKLPDTTHTWVNKSMSLNECKHKCLENCSCMAYMNSDIRGDGSGCVIWFGDLLDIRQLSVMGQDLYIRMRASQIAKNEHKVKTTVIIIAVTVVGLIPVVLSVIYYICRRKGSKPKDIPNSSEITNHENEGNKEDLELPLFDLCTIATATNNFSFTNKLGEGGYGPVYKGVLEDGLQIAVKRLSLSSGQGANEFKNEVRLIANLQHRNLVKLLGCCVQGGERSLVYEYLPNKSLDAFLFDPKQSKLLKWPMRFQIMCGIARGLLYLHQDSRLRIIHRDLKANNILLDKEMNPKISDFGIARTCGGDQTEGNTNRIVGTYGYMAPEYAFDGLFSIKSDVFSFGILLLEIVSGQKSSGFHHENDGLTLIGYASSVRLSPLPCRRRLNQHSTTSSQRCSVQSAPLVRRQSAPFRPAPRRPVPPVQQSAVIHTAQPSSLVVVVAWTLMSEGRSFELVDPYLRDSHDLAEVLRSIHIGLLCVQQNPVDRPNMSSVVLMLSSDSALSYPKEPGYFMKTNLLDNFSSPNQHVSISRNDMSITALEAR